MLQLRKIVSIISLVVFAMSVAPTQSLGQQRVDVLHLKNGSIIRGVIIEQIPDVSVTIRTSDGSQFVYAWDQIEKIVTEEAVLPSKLQPISERDRFKGFLIGFGVGVGSTSFSGRDSKTGVVTDFKIGYGPTNALAIYWFSKVAWINMDFGGASPSTLYLSGIGGIGASYAVASSVNVNGGIGFSNFQALDADEDRFAGNNDSGTGIVLGVEYEFSGHWFLNLDLLVGNTQFIDPTTIKLSINWLHY